MSVRDERESGTIPDPVETQTKTYSDGTVVTGPVVGGPFPDLSPAQQDALTVKGFFPAKALRHGR